MSSRSGQNHGAPRKESEMFSLQREAADRRENFLRRKFMHKFPHRSTLFFLSPALRPPPFPSREN